MSWILLILVEVVGAQGFSMPRPGQQVDQEGVRMCVRAVGEAWADTFLSQVYRSGTLAGGVGLVLPLHDYFVMDLEMTYKRSAGNELAADDLQSTNIGSALEIVPITLVVEARWPMAGGGEIFSGVGPSFIVFKEEHSLRLDTGLLVTQGFKVATDFRVGVRVDTGLAQPSMAPGIGRQLQAIEFEVYLGKRWQIWRNQTGFNLSAWRGSAGLVFRY